MKRCSINLVLVITFAMGFSPAVLAKEHPRQHEPQKISDREMASSPKKDNAKAVKTATVIIDGFQFMPDHVVLKKGGKVTFMNKDSTPHTVSPEPEAKFTGTGRLEKDAPAKAVVFTTKGEHHYFCEIHPSMKGKITVVE